jgi:hypothetical protein
MMIKIICFENGVQFTKRVKADPVEIKGFEKLKFAVHKTSYVKNIWKKEDGYTVSELSTGLAIESGYDKDNAIVKAARFLKKKGVRRVDHQIKKIKNGEYNPFKNLTPSNP